MERYGLTEIEYQDKMQELLSHMRQSQIIAIYEPYIDDKTKENIRLYFKDELESGFKYNNFIKNLKMVAFKNNLEEELLDVMKMNHI